MNLGNRKLLTALAVVGAVVWVYWPVLVRLVDAWSNDDNYSHGFLILPVAAYFAWERKDRFFAESRKPSWFGLVVFIGSLLVLLAGLLGSELFLTRISIVGTIAGLVLFLFGWHHLKIMAFPIGFLILMVPIPSIIFNQIAFPLQLLASRAGEWAISAVGIPVLREGNVLHLARTTLEVAEACSGIRSLVSLITLGIVYGYFMDNRTWVRVLIVASTIPVAIFANAARVAGTGMASHWIGKEAAQGFLHESAGIIVFAFAFLMLLVVERVIHKVSPKPIVPSAIQAEPAGAV